MKNSNILLYEVWEFFKPVWRILLVIIFAQFIGMTVSILSNYFGHIFLNVWYGAAYALPIGFILGLLWHIQAVPNSYSTNRLVIILIGLISILLPLFGFFTYDTLRFSLIR